MTEGIGEGRPPVQEVGAVELSLIIPAYNEAQGIVGNVAELKEWLRHCMPEITYEILVVDDGSTDTTADLVSAGSVGDARIIVLRHRANYGRGRAVRTGFARARGTYVVCLDADLSYGPDHIPQLLEPLRLDEADITLASAYHPAGSVSNVPFSRALLSRWGNRVLSAGLYGKFHTTTCIVRGYRREVLEQIELVSDGKDLHLEILQKAILFGLRVVEIPAHLKWRNRNRGAKRQGSLLSRLPFIPMSGTIASHLIYNYVLRPGSLLLVPILALLFTAFLGTLSLLGTWIYRLTAGPGSFGLEKFISVCARRCCKVD